MTANSADDGTLGTPITELDALRDRHEVPHSVETEVVDGDLVETIERLENLAVVGVTNDRGAVLLLRVTEDCELKPPTPSVAPDEDYAATARDWVESQAGFPITLEAVEGCGSTRPNSGTGHGRRAARSSSSAPSRRTTPPTARSPTPREAPRRKPPGTTSSRTRPSNHRVPTGFSSKQPGAETDIRARR